MVSSLPFLAPVFMRKVKDYKTKYSGGYGGSKGRQTPSQALCNGQHYKLSEISSNKSGFRSVNKSVSRETMLENGAIFKSVTYSVRVDDDSSQKSGMEQHHEPV
ncbi:hypothetical protein E4U55_007669 [Claviceps digitariae]|nr:hypothetical protein E4U55_007669 [Claviceps digitariae]